MNERDPQKTGRVIVLGVIFLLLVGANLFCFFYHGPVASAPNTKNEYVPRPQSRISLPPKQRVPVNEAPAPVSPSPGLAAITESAFYLGEWAALETDNSLEPDLFPTPSPEISGGNATGNTNSGSFDAGTFVASGASGGYSAGSGGEGYTIPTGFTMANTYGSSLPNGLSVSTASGVNNNTIPDVLLPGLSDDDSDDAGDGSGEADGGLAAAGSGDPEGTPDPDDTQDPDDPDNPMPPDAPLLCVLGGAPPPPPESASQITENSATGPEPATGILLFCAIASTAALRRRKRRKA